MKITVDLPEDAMDRSCGFIRYNGGDNAVLDITVADAESSELNSLMFHTIYVLAEVQREAESDTPSILMIKAVLRNLLETYSAVLDELESASSPGPLDSSEDKCNSNEAVE